MNKTNRFDSPAWDKEGCSVKRQHVTQLLLTSGQEKENSVT